MIKDPKPPLSSKNVLKSSEAISQNSFLETVIIIITSSSSLTGIKPALLSFPVIPAFSRSRVSNEKLEGKPGCKAKACLTKVIGLHMHYNE